MFASTTISTFGYEGKIANAYFCTFADERFAGLRVRDRGQHIMHLADTVTCLSLLYFSDLALLYFCVFCIFHLLTVALG